MSYNGECTVDRKRAIDVLAMILRHTNEDPVKASAIEAFTGVNTREVSALVAEFIAHGFPICSGTLGFWRAKDEREFRAQLAKERDRAIQILRKVNGGKKNCNNEITLFEQETAA